YLAANLEELREDTKILEFVLGARAGDMAEQLLAEHPPVIGFGVYIWNVEETTRLVAVLKRVAPDVTIVVGGPEVSYETESQRICDLAECVVRGWADLAFAELCRTLLAGSRPASKMIAGGEPALAAI